MKITNEQPGVYDQRGVIVRVAYLCVSLFWHLITGLGRLAGPRVITLCYHDIPAGRSNQFARQIKQIASRAVPVEALHAHCGRSRGTLPMVCLTFDDAYANVADNALPVLRAHDVPATIFVATDELGGTPRWLAGQHVPQAAMPIISDRQLDELARDPLITIGSHTHTHTNLAQLDRDAVQWELRLSRQILRDRTGTDITALAVPYGACTDETIRLAAELGYARLFVLDGVPNGRVGECDVIGRYKMAPNVWPIEFTLTVAGAYAWLPVLRRVLRRLSPRNRLRFANSVTTESDYAARKAA